VSSEDAGPELPSEAGERDPLIGSTLKDTYRVTRRVGEGGMGRVYEAEHVRLRRRVAIKVLLGQYSSHPEVIARFRREAEVIGSLGHPHIVQVVDVDETDDGEQFLVMEFLEGETLADRLEREPRLPLLEALRITSQVASALAGTHEKEIVHRDLKPENIFLVHISGEKDFVKVLDFGISKVRSGGPKLTAHNVVIGTPAYMAPEQARAESNVDHRADQFALAAMTYEMLAGISPFPGDDPMDVMAQVVVCRPQPLNEVAPWVPPAVQQVVMRGLSREPGDRYPSVTVFSRSLDVAAQGANAPNTLRPDHERVGEKTTVPRTLPSEKETMPRPRQAAPEAADRATVPRFRPGDSPTVLRPNPSEPEIPDLGRPPSRPPGSSPPAFPRPSGSNPPAGSRPPAFGSQRVGSSNPPPFGRPSTPRPPHPSSQPQALDRISSSPVSARQISAAENGEKTLTQAQELHQEARSAFADGRLDEAVAAAERLMELGVFGRDPAVFGVLRSAMPLLDRIFEARVGDGSRRLELTERARNRSGSNLSSKAEHMLRCVDEKRTVQAVFDACGVPRRDAIRMLAGLMRRGLVE
jgi:serine/threonine protein kinase